MDLKQFFTSNPQVSEFDESNLVQHQQIQTLISKPMDLLGLSLVYQRTPLFNDLLKAQGLLFKTIISRRNERLTGLFSVSSSPRLLKGLPTVVAYLGDFRIENDLKIAAFWRKHYGQMLSLFSINEELGKPKIFITAILKDNKLAHRTLVENPHKQSQFKYHFLRTVKMVNILSKPFSFSSKNTFRVRYVKDEEEERLLSFLDAGEKNKVLGFDYLGNQRALWNHRKKHFPGFQVSRFLVVENQNNEWVATTLPASPDPIKRMILQKVSRVVRLFFSILRLFGASIPNEGNSIKTLYLTHFNLSEEANSKHAIESMVQFLQKNKISSSYHMISFADWWNTSWKEYLTYSVDVNLFEVTESQAAPRVATDHRSVLGFEMALV